MNIAIRPIATSESERNLVRQSWMRSARSSWMSAIPKNDYYDVQTPIVNRLVERAHVVVAESTDVPGELAGWACYDGDVFHFAYVKESYRRFGVGRTLVGHAGPFRYCTYRTPMSYRCSLFKDMQFNPYAVSR